MFYSKTELYHLHTVPNPSYASVIPLELTHLSYVPYLI